MPQKSKQKCSVLYARHIHLDPSQMPTSEAFHWGLNSNTEVHRCSQGD